MNSSMVTPDLHRWLNNGVTSDCSIGLNEFEEVVAPSKFIIPPVAQPSVYCEKNFSAEYGADMNQDIKFSKGTTTLSFMFEHGVIVAVDSRATQGAYIASNSVMKVIDITPKILGTMAGGAADCQFWERHLGRQCRLFELRNQEEMTVRGASKLLAAIMANYRGYGLSMGTMICGYNGIYYVDNDGMRLAASRQNPYFSVGSGSTYAYGVLDQHYAHDLSVDAAVELGKRAIYHAGHRDAMSGGIINVYYIGPHGHEKRWTSDLMVIHDSIN